MRNPFDRSRLRLKPLQVPGLTEPLEFSGGRLTLGRSPDNDLELPADSFPSVSTHHARIELVDDELWVEDLGSTNGTLVNGEKIERVTLKTGDVVQLGSIGPRFVVISSAPLSETMFVDPKSLGAGKDNLSTTRFERIFRRRTRVAVLRVAALGTVAVAALVWWGLDLTRRGEKRRQQLEQLEQVGTAQGTELEEARAVIAALRRDIEGREEHLAQQEQAREIHVQKLEDAIHASEEEATALTARLVALEKSGASAIAIAKLQASIASTQEDLDQAKTQFAKFDPINLEQARLTGVSKVRDTVVLLEIETSFTEGDGGELLHIAFNSEPNFEGRGEPFVMDSTGSGFCVSPEGWIITNRHVVRPELEPELQFLLGELDAFKRITVHAVFSGTARRYPVEIVTLAEGENDLALVKIEPFEGMPYLEEFEVDIDPPEQGSSLYLFGFPLGNFALQEGRTVIASTFRGILSRRVSGHLQVDAGVHPGNSGGPITDDRGRVIGVVFSVQAMPDQTAIFTIGYGIPIRGALEIWPPPEDWRDPTPEEEPDEEEQGED